MDNTTKMQVEEIINRGWYRKSQTLGEGGWGEEKEKELKLYDERMTK